MAVTTEDGRRYTLYSAPSQFDHGEVARFGSIDREGLKAITRTIGPGLKTLGFTHTIAARDYQRSIEHVILPLTRLARDAQRVRFVGGSTGYEQGVWWVIKDLQVKVTQRALDNRISRADLSWSLEEHVDVAVNLIRRVPSAAAVRPAAAAARQHTVAPGETLWSIAARYLGNGARWGEIARLNAATLPNPNLIRVGQVLRIPAR
jgi:LysM repeat protein